MRSPMARSLGPLAIALFLSACISGGGLGTAVKTIGSSSKSGASSSADSFTVTLAVRDSSTDNTAAAVRQVQLQGLRNLDSAKFVNTCGATGSTCSCTFYKDTVGTGAEVSTSVSLSSDINTFNCDVPTTVAAVDVDLYKYVILKSTDGAKQTGLIPIKGSSTLTLTDVIGGLDVKKVRKIQRYSCRRTFFEGQGVAANTITCVANQNLAVITATYNYYLYTSQSGNNTADKTLDVAFDTAICSNNNFLKLSCSSSVLDDRYGLYAENASPFNVLITYTAKPDAAPATATTGFAALPDSSGNCPVGLTKVKPWIATPPSITAGSLNTTPANYSSNFINNGSLNNTIVEDATTTPTAFAVSRAPNQTACSAAAAPDPGGDCSGITLGAATEVIHTTYAPLTPVICVIPKSLLGGI